MVPRSTERQYFPFLPLGRSQPHVWVDYGIIGLRPFLEDSQQVRVLFERIYPKRIEVKGGPDYFLRDTGK